MDKNEGRRKYKVYLLDDDPTVLELIEAILVTDRSYYYDIKKFSNPVDTLKFIHKDIPTNLPDILILDLNLPIMNGFEICQKLKSNSLTSNITIIVVTAYNSNHIWYNTLLTYRADYYITKPFEYKRFLDCIHNIIKLKNKELPNNIKNETIAKII